MEKNAMKYRMAGFLAAAAMLGFLAAFGVIAVHEIPVKNKDFFNMALVALIGFVSTAFGYYLGSSQGSARKTELQATAPIEPTTTEKAETADLESQAGRARMGSVLMLLAMLCIGLLVACVSGCATNQTATQQMAAQTSDAGTISLGAYVDANDAYIDALELYKPYRSILQQYNPDLNEKILGYFREANTILDDWEQIGTVSDENQETFRDLMRRISLEQALLLEQKLNTEED